MMISTNWFMYLCIQFIIFAVAIESWMYVQSIRGRIFAKPIPNKEEEIKMKVISGNSFTSLNFDALHFEDQTSYDEVPRSE